MEKSCHSSGATSDVFLKHLNKLSHKISKPNRTHPSPPITHNLNRPSQSQSQPSNTDNDHQMAAPPPVYTINKNDFRTVVQRLTGSPASSPARERLSSPPPPQPKYKPSSSRLQKIRPPPLAQISNHPPDMPNCAVDHSHGSFFGGQRQPLSPLPPFPTVHAAAESPVSAYMRFLQNSLGLRNGGVTNTDFKKFPIGSSRWNNVAPPQNLHYPRCNNTVPPQWNNESPPRPPSPPHQPQQNTCTSVPAFPSSPLPFGCLLPSPGMFSPTLLPPSPTLPVPSPRWRGD